MTQRRRRPVGSHQLRADRLDPLRVVRLGTVSYSHGWDLQRRLVERRRVGQVGDVLLLLEHPAVYTLGTRADRDHILLGEQQLDDRGIEVVQVDRGGDVTYHGPGQLVGYPILKLASIRGVVDYVRALEEVLLRTAATFGITAQRVAGLTGIWVGDQKLAAIGVRVASGGITSHGFAFNVAPRLEDFGGIIPCGIPDRGVCSLQSLGVHATIEEVTTVAQTKVAEVFGATLELARAVDVDPTTGSVHR